MNLIKNQVKVLPWQKKCKHKVVIVNSMIERIYCKRCHKNLSNNEYHNFVTDKIHKGKWEKSYEGDAYLWD